MYVTYGATQWAAVKICLLEIIAAPQYWPDPVEEGRSKAANQGQAFFFEAVPPTILVCNFMPHSAIWNMII